MLKRSHSRPPSRPSTEDRVHTDKPTVGWMFFVLMVLAFVSVIWSVLDKANKGRVPEAPAKVFYAPQEEDRW